MVRLPWPCQGRGAPRPYQYCLALLAFLLLGGVLPARAQRAFSITVAPTNQNSTVIRWRVQAVTVVGDLLVVPRITRWSAARI